jgi:hypothetical protein
MKGHKTRGFAGPLHVFQGLIAEGTAISPSPRAYPRQQQPATLLQSISHTTAT